MTSESTAARDETLVHIRPRPGWRLPELRELWRFRHVVVMLSIRDLKVRYKQTVLGVGWVVLQPLIGAGIFSFVFGGVAGLEAPGEVPYFLFSFVGLLGWNLFSSLANRSSAALVGSAPLLQKVYFPRLLVPISKFSSSLVDFAVAIVLLVGLLIWFWRLPFATGVALAIGCTVLFLMLALGLGLAAGAISVYYRDVQYLVPVLLQFLLYASPVAYAVEAVPERYLFFYQLNPLSGLLEAFRWGVLGVGELDPGLLSYAAGVTLVVFLGGVLFFKRLEASFADVV